MILPLRAYLIPILSVIVLIAICAHARAAELPCPPKHYACWEVKAIVDMLGEQKVIDKAKACGWSAAKINEALKCIK